MNSARFVDSAIAANLIFKICPECGLEVAPVQKTNWGNVSYYAFHPTFCASCGTKLPELCMECGQVIK
jgi:hypothetical protein